MEMAASAVKGTYSGMRSAAVYTRDGPLSLRLMGALGGLALTGVSFAAFFGNLWTLNVIGSLVQAYLLVFGLISFFLEFHEKCHCVPKRIINGIYEYAKFLTMVWGRGMWYFFLGSLSLGQWNLPDIIVGAFLMGLGLAMGYFGNRGMTRLKDIRKKIKDENDLREKFDEYDVNKDGSLDTKEMAQFCQDLGAKLTLADLETCVMNLDRDNNGRVEFSEFLLWWINQKYATKV